MRPLRLPVGAKRRGNLKQEVPNSPKSSKIFKQFCEIATAASGLAMTKSDFFDSLSGPCPPIAGIPILLRPYNISLLRENSFV